MAKPNTPSVDLSTMSTEEKIKYHYEHGQGSIQDIARVYRCSVDEVLHIIGQDDLTTVTFGGDLVDAEDINRVPGMTPNYGTTDSVRYSTN